MGYLDPGIFGMISQIGYVLLFAVVSAFMFLFQPLKNLFGRVFGRGTAGSQRSEMEDAADGQEPGR
jgi:hypothetical protein